MFQTFENKTEPAQGIPRLQALRDLLATQALHGFIVPRADQYQGEYVAPNDERLAWLTGFTGSAGFAAILPNIAGVFVDGRYRLQVKAQVADAFTPVHWPETSLASWLLEHAAHDAVIGYDPWLHTRHEIETLRAALKTKNIGLQGVSNPIDALWQDRPVPANTSAMPHDLIYAGETSADKRGRLAGQLRDDGQSAAIITLPDSLCWLLNIRGRDLPRVPLVQGFAILHADAQVDVFCVPEKFDGLALDKGVCLHPLSVFKTHLKQLSGKLRLDPHKAPIAIYDLLNTAQATTQDMPDICLLPKAIKNKTEQEGARAAHIRDARAMCEFLAWLAAQDKRDLHEIDIIQKLEQYRTSDPLLRDISFDTICGSGPNGAIVHYRVSEDSNRALAQDALLLLDSGGQYLDGTTDITRTIAIGAPSADMSDTFTRVLQGMIALSCARFPKGLTGRDLDVLARTPLWQVGRDYDHGTGHGVGSFLSVHEGPQNISRRSEEPLRAGMIVSNEPGYYKEGSYGIRIENLLIVQDAPPLSGADKREMLCLETLTFVPIERALINVDMLTAGERAWVNTYHATIYERLAGDLSAQAAQWLKGATRPI